MVIVMTVEDILNQVERLCRKYDVEHLYLFGSHATGTATPTSDIDIVIKGGNHIGLLKEEIEHIKTLKKIDVFEYDKCKNQYLKEDIDLYAKKIY